MKVFVVNPFLSRKGGGIFEVIKELYNTSSFRKSSFSPITFWGYKDDFTGSDSNELAGDVKLFTPKWSRINFWFFSKKFSESFYLEVSENTVLHLHSLWLFPSFFINVAQKRKKAPKIISTHGMLNKRALTNGVLRKKIAYSLFEKKNLLSADCIHALSEEEYFQIRKLIPKVPIAIIPNGITLPRRNYSHSKKKEKKTLLFLGRIHPIKGLENLIKAWSIVKNKKNWQLIIAGPDENNHSKDLKKIVDNLEMSESIIFAGPKFGIEKHNLLSNVDAFVLPSFSEGIPMSVLEAWSYRLPVLKTPQCNLREGFDLNAAIQIETNYFSIEKGITKLFSLTEDDLLTMGNNGYNLVGEKYTWETVADQMIELYDWVSFKGYKPAFVRID